MATNSSAGVYWVYENFPNNKAAGHVSTCSHFKKQGGNAPRTGRWYGPFDHQTNGDPSGSSHRQTVSFVQLLLTARLYDNSMVRMVQVSRSSSTWDADCTFRPRML
jgi:hypothetical protein